jgi:hypothetical protein
MSYQDSTTGQDIPGKAYVLKSTEGEEIVDPARLFQAGGQADDELAARVARIEEALGIGQEPVAEQDPEA